MALHILQPGLRPIGQFDLKVSQTVTGGEIGILEEDTNTGNSTEDSAAADSLQVGPISNGDKVMVALGSPLAIDTDTNDSSGATLRFLLDEGTAGYGTLFGGVIGGTTGKGVTYGLSSSGAVLADLGPATHFGSGKVTCWHAPGLYAVSGSTAAPAQVQAARVNDELWATSAGVLGTTANGDAVAVSLGAIHDDSLVSTSVLTAGGQHGSASKYAIYFLGQR